MTNYTHDFVNSLLHEGYYSISHIISADEISNLLFSNFQFAATNGKNVTGIWLHFIRCEVRQEKDRGNNSFDISYAINKKAFPILRRFIFKKDIDGFIKLCVRKIPFENKYTLGSTAKDIFKSIEVFIWLLKRDKHESIYKDRFIEFCEALKNPDSKEGILFDFSE